MNRSGAGPGNEANSKGQLNYHFLVLLAVVCG